MGKAKFLIVAAIVFFVQTGLSRGLAVAEKPTRMASVSADEDCDWPMFGRTPDGNRVAPDSCGPKSYKLKKIWDFETNEDNYVITPIVAKGKIFFGSEDIFPNLQCLNAETGVEIWRFDTHSGFIEAPAISNGKIFAATKNEVYCLDENTGKKIWIFESKLYIESSLIVSNGRVLFGGDRFFNCLDANTGRLLWDFSSEKYSSTAAVYNGKVYFGSSGNVFYCLDIANGSKIWDFKCGYWSTASPSVSNNKVYFGSTDKKLYCLDSNNGKKIWEFYAGELIDSAPVVTYGNVYFGCWDNKLYCLDEKTGKLKWEFKTERYIDSSPAVSNKMVFICSNDYNLYCINAINGEMLWKYKTGYSISRSSPVIANGKVYVRSHDNKVYCFGDSGDYEPVPTSIKLIINKKKIDLCEKLQITATTSDEFEQEIINPELEWSVEPPGIGTIDATGLFTPSKTGVAKITCRCGDVEATVDINVVDFLVPSVKTLVLTNVKPYQNYKSTLTYTNNSDSRLDVKLIPSTDLISLEPSSFSVDAGKTFDVLVSCKLKEFVPSAVTSFTINADYGGCPDILHGTIMNADKYSCFMVSPEMLDFGLVKRGDSKTMTLAVESNAKQTFAITCDQPWVEISKKSISLDVGQKETIDFKIMASSLPASSKLTANITVISDQNFCEQTTIPLLVSTEDSITINLQVDSRIATINGQEGMLDVPARIIGGRTMVPLRFISESFGCSIQWDPTTQKIGIIRYDITVNLWIGKDYVEVNGNKLKIDAPPVIVGGRTMVPLRFIAEPFGAKVDWNAQTKGITITWPKL